MKNDPTKYINWAISSIYPIIRLKNLHRNFQIPMKTVQFVFIKFHIQSMSFTKKPRNTQSL